MNTIEWKYVKPLKDKKSIENFLKDRKVNLPENLERCLVENNGGRPKNILFDTNKGKEYIFQSLFSYNKDDNNEIYRMDFENFENENIYPIGIEAAGNIICYHLQEKKYVLWNHETNDCEEICQLSHT